MKKFISVMMSVIMMMSVLSVGTYAAVRNTSDVAMPMYEISDTFISAMSYKDSTAACKTSIILAQSEKWISITQIIEKKSSSGFWEPTNTVWSVSATSDSNYYIFSNSRSITVSGEYRLKSEAVVKNSAGTVETITKYSNPITVN